MHNSDPELSQHQSLQKSSAVLAAWGLALRCSWCVTMPTEHAVRVLSLLIVPSQLEEMPTVWVFGFLHGTSLFLETEASRITLCCYVCIAARLCCCRRRDSVAETAVDPGQRAAVCPWQVAPPRLNRSWAATSTLLNTRVFFYCLSPFHSPWSLQHILLHPTRTVTWRGVKAQGSPSRTISVLNSPQKPQHRPRSLS